MEPIKIEIMKIVVSNDHTKKYYFKTESQTSSHIEACLLHLSRYGHIICVSSQIGCPHKCKFCAAGNSTYIRNLSSFEIQEQIRLVVEDNPTLATDKFQVTYMGSGEPLINYKNVFDSLDNIRIRFPNLEKANLSTTCPSAARQYFDTIDWKKYDGFLHFQYSLHFTQDVMRCRYLSPQLMKISEAIGYLNRISLLLNDTYKINYIPFDQINDSLEQVEELKSIMDTTQNAILKISTMCEINGCHLSPSRAFGQFASCAGKTIENVQVFSSDGTDISAGCGQFYNESVL